MSNVAWVDSRESTMFLRVLVALIGALGAFLQQGLQGSVEGDLFNLATNSWSGWRE